MDVFAQDAALPGGGGGGFSLEWQQRKVRQSKLEEFFPGEDVEAADDVNLQWLSMFVEECLSSTSATTTYSATDTAITGSSNYSDTTTPSTSTSTFTAGSLLPSTPRPPPPKTATTPEPSANKQQPATTPRRPIRTKKRRAGLDNYHLYGNGNKKHNSALFVADDDGSDDSAADPQLLQQAYWLADSELLVRPQTHHQQSNHQPGRRGGPRVRSTATSPSSAPLPAPSSSLHPHAPGDGHQHDSTQLLASPAQQQHPVKRCTHCQSHTTPQWREGPMGRKTLCNACGVRYRSGRLLPEYRPARSPTFETCKHSNSHRKVMEMRLTAAVAALPHSSRSR